MAARRPQRGRPTGVGAKSNGRWFSVLGSRFLVLCMFAIETENLHKSFDDLVVLRGLDLRVPQGCVYGILGPNGAGKSTLIHLLLGFLKPTKGMLLVLGEDNIESIRGR